jgi:hypothetical protein
MWLLAAAALALFGEGSVAATLTGTPENYRTLLPGLKPGDMLRLSSGIYLRGLPLHGLSGEPEKPIVIVGDTSGSGVVLVARPGANTISIKDSAYLVVRSLRLDGAGFPVDAVKAEGTSTFAHHIALENLTIVNHGVDQQTVGISTKCPAWNWVIRGNVIRGAGTGIYLGNSDGSAPFIGGVIENNLIVDTVGYNLEIKHQTARPATMPAEPAQTVIRHNVFSKASNGSSGPLARPNVLLGHFPLSGVGADDSYVVYGNFFHENPTEALLQAEGTVDVHDNVFVNSAGDAVRIQPHHAPLRSVAVRQNTIVAHGVGIRLRGADQLPRQSIEANAVFAGLPIAGDAQRWNVTGAYEAAREFLVAPFAKPGEMDFAPRGGALDLAEIANGMMDESADFYGRRRRVAIAGAIAAMVPVPWRLGLTSQPVKEPVRTR